MATRTTTRARTGHVTFEEFCTRVREDQKADLIDGVIYMASPENINANELHGWLLAVLRAYVRRKKSGRVFSLRVAMKLDEQHSPEPDLVFVRNEHAGRIRRGQISGPADLAVEIVSPASVTRDYEAKRALYEQFGVSEYWIIDEDERAALFLRLDARGRYREVRLRNGAFHSEAVEKFWLRVDWLWQQPQPDIIDTVVEILGKTPRNGSREDD